MEFTDQYWRLCSSCKKPIKYSSKYYECNVSTCTGRRTGYVFCSVPCWETHLPQARHRDAWAIENSSPSLVQYQQELKAESAVSKDATSGRRLIIKPATPAAPSLSASQNEILVVVSKMKQYVKDRADMNTAGEVADTLSDLIRRACDDAIDQARADGRKTIMTRDFKQD